MRRRDLLIVLFVLFIGMLSSEASVAQERQANGEILANVYGWQSAMLEEMEQALHPKKPLAVLELNYDREANTVTYGTYVRAVLEAADGNGDLRIDLVCRLRGSANGGTVRMWSDSDNERYSVVWDPIAYNDEATVRVRQQARAYFTALRKELYGE